MNKKLTAMAVGLFVLFSWEMAVAGVTVTDVVLSKEKQASAGKAQQQSAKKSGEKAGNTSTPLTAGNQTKK